MSRLPSPDSHNSPSDDPAEQHIGAVWHIEPAAEVVIAEYKAANEAKQCGIAGCMVNCFYEKHLIERIADVLAAVSQHQF